MEPNSNGTREMVETLRDTREWVITDATGDILEASAAAAKLLSISAGHLRRRSLLLFFHDNRPEWQRVLTEAARGERVERAGLIRPRDRRPRPVHVQVARAQEYPAARAVVWRFSQQDAAAG